MSNPVSDRAGFDGAGVQLRVKGRVDDQALTRLHAEAFGTPVGPTQGWTARLTRWSLSWVVAVTPEHELVGFVHACGDGAQHAFLLDTVVASSHRHLGLGTRLVGALAAEVTKLGCTWLHVDYTHELEPFYRDACGFGPTAAGLLRLR